MDRVLRTLVVLIVLFLPVVVPAQTVQSIEGEIFHGNSLIIRGIGFGSKATPGPVVWDDFEAGVNGQTVPGKDPVIGPAWDGYNSGISKEYSDSAQRSGSSLSAMFDFASAGASEPSIASLVQVHPTDEVFLTFWYKLVEVPLNGTIYPCDSIKPVYIYGDHPGSNGEIGIPDFTFGMRSFPNSDATFQLQSDVPPYDITYPPDDFGWGNNTYYGDVARLFGDIDGSTISGEWIRFDFYLKGSRANSYTQDGKCIVWTHRPETNAVVNMEIDGLNVVTRSTDGLYRQFLFNAMYQRDSRSPDARAYIYLDDAYLDVTQARVELGNAPTWANCTFREIQIPTAWTSGEITVTLNTGSFAPTNSAYLFVVDSAGRVSPGFQVTVGQGTDLGPAKPSTPIRIGNG